MNQLAKIFRFIWLHFLMLSFVGMNFHSAYADVLVAAPAHIQGGHAAAKSQMVPSSAIGNIRPDNSVAGHNVYMDRAANGVPVVNINNPNGAGVSHNKFVDFNVGAGGVVINNSKDLLNSTIGGAVQGNSNLHTSARAIINEVTGSGRSYINGTQEILGMKADYILANPNGISINGGDFINANRAAFTTARVVLDSLGNLDKLVVEKGNIEILGRELNVKDLDYFDIIARTVTINTKIHAGSEARIITGKGELNVKDEKFTSANNPAAPSVSIDSSHLGGLYAGRIRLISNENGVGVNLPDMNSSSGDIEISASGKIVHKRINSAAKVQVESRYASIVVPANVKTNAKEVSYVAHSDIAIADTAIVSASDKVQIKSHAGIINNKGKIVSAGSGGLSISTKSLENTGDIYAKDGDLSIDASADINNKAKITSQRTLRVNVAGKFQNRSIVSSLGPTLIMGDGSFENSKGSVVRSKGDFYSNLAGNIDNSGEIIITGGLDLRPSQGIQNVGKLEADYIDIIEAGGLVNAGEIISRGRVKFDSNIHVNNSGLISAAKEIDIKSVTDTINSAIGKITSLTSLKINAGGVLDNHGTLLGTKSAEILSGKIFKNSGSLESLASLEITSAGSIQNTGKIIASNIITMEAVLDISNAAKINAQQINIKSTAGGLLNSKNIIAEKSVKLVIARETNNSGKISALTENIILQSSQGGLDNSGDIIAPTINLATKTNIDNSKLIKATDIVLHTDASLNNSGTIDAQSSNTMTAGIDINNRSGSLLAGDALKLATGNYLLNDDKSLILSKKAEVDFIVAGNVRNAGRMESALNLVGKSAKAIVNAGVILAHQNLTLDADIGIDNQAAATIESDANLRLQSAGVLLNKGVIIADDDVSLILAEDITNEGRIESLKDLEVISSAGRIINTGQLLADGTSLYKSAGDFVNNNTVRGDLKLSIASAGKIINQGKIIAGEALESHDKLGFSNEGGIAAGGKLVINTDDMLINKGLILGQNTTEINAVNNIANIDAGEIESHGHLSLTSGGKIININNDPTTYVDSGIIALSGLLVRAAGGIDNLRAHIEAKDNIEIVTAGAFNNVNATLLSNAGLRLLVDGDINNSGVIQVTNDLQINSVAGGNTASLVNTGYISSGEDLNIKLQNSSQNDGVLQAKDKLNLIVSAGDFINKGIMLSQFKNIGITVEGDIHNSQMAIIDALEAVSLVSNKGKISNAGRIFSVNDTAHLQAATNVENTGSIIAKGAIMVDSTAGDILNSTAKAHIVSLAGGVALSGAKLIKNSAHIQAAQNITITSSGAGFENDGGKVIADQNIIITAKDIINSATAHIQATKSVTLTAENTFDNIGVIIADSGNITAQKDISNTGNIQLNSGMINSVTGSINNAQYISSVGAIVLNAKQDIINHGDIEVSELSTSSGRLLNHGQIKSDSKFLVNNSKIIENHGLIEFATMDADVVIIDNKKDANIKGTNLAIKAKDFLNNGATEVTGKLQVGVDNLTSNILSAKGKTDITIIGDFINNKKLHIIGDDLTLRAKSITNTGEFKARNFTATATGAFNNSGMVFGANAVAINAPASINNSNYIISGGTTTLATSGALTNSKGIYGATSVTTNSSTLTNSGEIKSAGSVSTTAGSTTNTGTLAGRNSLTVNGALNNSGTVISSNNVTVNAGGGSIDNAGNITSHGNATLNSAALNNRGVLQAVGTLRGFQSGTITNDYSIYGGIIDLTAGGAITNNARIIANNTLGLISSGDVTNKQEISLLGKGDLVIKGRNIYNNRAYEHAYSFVDIEYLIANAPKPRESQDWGWFDGVIGKYSPDQVIRNVETRRKFTVHDMNKHSNSDAMLTDITQSVKSNKYYFYDKKLAGIEAVKPIISSSGDVYLRADGGDINNSGGVIQATNNATIVGSNLINSDIYITKHEIIAPTKEITHFKHYEMQGVDHIPLPIVLGVPVKTIQQLSIIQAGGSIRSNLGKQLLNGSSATKGSSPPTLRQSVINAINTDNYTVLAPGSVEHPEYVVSEPTYKTAYKKAPTQGLLASAQSLSTIPAPLIKSPSAIKLSLQRDRQARSAKATMDLPELSQLVAEMASQYEHPSSVHITPTSSESWQIDDAEIMAALIGSDWDKPLAPANYFIKETSPVFTDVEKYFSTDNFIKRIPGYNPKQSYVHYGDPVKQMDLVRRQMVETTGLASLDGQVDYIAQMKKLYDSGVEFGNKLQLTPGISLSPQQVAQLRDDIVWAEEIVLNGTKIIVPKLYVAASKRNKKASGMLAKNIEIEAASIINTSSIIGDNIALIARKGSIVNSDGGDIYASKHLQLNSAGNITNISSTIRSNGSAKLLAGGNIVNSGGGKIHASQHLHLEAAGDIRNIGSEIGSDGSATLFAGGNIENITESQRYDDSISYLTTLGPKAKIKVASKLTMQSLGDLVNRGASIESGDLTFAVGGSLRNESIAEESGMEISGEGHHYKQSSVVYRPSSISSSGDISGFVAGDFNLIGSKIAASGDASINVLGDSHLLSQVASESMDSYSSSKTTNALGGTNRSSESYQSHKETLVPASIKAGGKNTLINSRDQVLYGAEMHGGKGVHLKSRKTSILAARLDNYSASNSYDKGMVFEETESSGQKSSTHAHSILSSGLSAGLSSGPIEIESELLSIDYTKSTSGSIFGPKTITEHKPLWARQLAGKQISCNPLEDHAESWDESSTRLTPEAAMVVSISAAIGTAWMGGFGMFAAPATTATTAATATTATIATTATASTISTMGTAMWQAGAVSLASSGSVSLINNQFDLGKVASDLTSSDALKSLSLSMASAGLVSGIGQTLQLGQLAPGMSIGDRARILAQQSLVSASVRTALAGASGEGPSDIISSELLTSTLALGQSVIGDLGLKHGLDNGSIAKTALHSTLGGIYSAATGSNISSGIIGGAISELLPSLMESASGTTSPPTPGSIKAATQIATASTTLLSGGSAQDVSNASKVASSAIEHNRRLHPEELVILKRAQKGKTPEEQERLKAAALSLIRGDAGVNQKDPSYKSVKNMVDQGDGYSSEKATLIAMARSSGDETSFIYNKLTDAISDGLSRNNELLTRASGGVKIGVGSLGVLFSAGVGTVAAPATGGASSIVAASIGTASVYQVADGYDQAYGSFYHTEGSKVLRSIDLPTHSFAYDAHTNIALDAAATVGGGGAVLQGLGGSVVQGIKASKILITDGAITAKEGVINAVNTVKGQVRKLRINPEITKTSTVGRSKRLSDVNYQDNVLAKRSAGKTIQTSEFLLPREGEAGIFRELDNLGVIGDNLTPHHMPSAAYMKAKGVKRSEGVSIMVEQPTPGIGGRHRKTETYGKKTDLSKNPRDELAKDIIDLRGIYKEDNLYKPKIKNGMLKVIDINKTKFPELFTK